MGGRNPYIGETEARLPTQVYSVHFVLGDSGETKEVEVDPSALPYTDEGLPGSLLDIACGKGIDLDHACGGVAACSTCHVVVEDGEQSTNEISEAEEDMLDMAAGLTDRSRLGCQCIPDGSKTVRVLIPSWNRNLVSEEH